MIVRLSLLVAALFAGLCTSAQHHETQNISKFELYERSRVKKNAALALVSTGGATFVVGAAGVLVSVVTSADSFLNDDWFSGNNHFGNKNIYGFLLITGIGAVVALGSIPLFVASHRDKKRAQKKTSLILKVEHAQQLTLGGIQRISYPSAGVQFNF